MIQVIAIHGGTTFTSYDDYLEYLRTKSVSLDRLTYKPMWRELLQQNLGDEYQVLLPAMPNKTNARYAEWKLWFDNLTQVFTDDCILIGHSLGALFLAKYVSENVFPRKIKATILIATPFQDETDEDLTDFKLESISDLFRDQAGKVMLFNGDNDPVISQEDVALYKKYLPQAEFHTLSAPDHFMRVEFPELIETIKNL